MTLTARLAVAMVTLVTLTAGAVGILSYFSLQQALFPRALDRLETHARFVAADLESYVRGARDDIASFPAEASLQGLVHAHLAGGIDPIDGVSEATWRERLCVRLIGELRSKSSYEKFRIIGIENDGRELIRVDRSGPNGAIRAVPEIDLQQKSHRNYFKETIKLKDGEIYVSPIGFKRSNGVLVLPRVAILRLATPLLTPDGRPFAIVVINIDMRSAFDSVRSSVREHEKIYVVNERGDYLVHPDSNREFNTVPTSAKWQDDFPALAIPLNPRQAVAKIIHDRAGESSVAALAPAILAGSQWVGVIETIPSAVSLAPAATIQTSSLLVGFAATLFAAALAIQIARSLIGPLVRLTAAVEGFAMEGPVAVPVEARGEIGVLARAFSRARDEVRSKTAALENEIREHRRTESARDHHAERARLLSAAVEFSNDAIITELLDGTITSWNSGAERLFGFTVAEAVGSHIDMIVPGDRRAEVRSFLERIAGGERIQQQETVRLRKGGSPVDVSLGISPIRSASGQIVGASKIAHDITERRRAQEELLDSEQLARGIIDTALDAFVQMDEAGVVVDWNLQAEKVFGWSRGEALGKNLGDLMIPEIKRADFKRSLDRFLLTDAGSMLGKRLEVDGQRFDGKKIRVELSVTALKRHKGIVFNGFIRDLTEKHVAEEQLRQAQKMEAVGQLTGGIAHDFNNILTVITGTIEILSEAVKDKPLLATITKMIDEAAGRGAELTRHLLAFARKQPLQPSNTDVNALIIDTAKLLRPTLGEHIVVESIFEDEKCLALVDPNQLASALLNLALNARDAMPQGGKLIVETSSVYFDEDYANTRSEVRSGRYMMIAVSDTGTGIPSEMLGKVFDPLFTSKGPGKGTGLGLSMVYGFVKQSAGHIQIYSEEGHGTTVRIYLPPATGALPVVELESVAAVTGSHETVLVVEDDVLVQHYVLTQLHALGYSTLKASTATEALGILDAGAKIDLLFTDIIMPGRMNGRYLSDEVRRRQPAAKVLFTSGYTENAIVRHGRLDPGVLLLAKPYRKSDLARMVRQALDAPGKAG